MRSIRTAQRQNILQMMLWAIVIIIAALFASNYLFGNSTESAYAAGATRYYVDATNGSDANDGRSPETAWRNHPDSNLATGVSLAKKTTFVPGDTIFMKKGEIWRNTILMAATAGQSGSPITTTVKEGFGTGAAPIISASVLLNGSWTSTGVNGEYKTPLTTEPFVVYDGDTRLKSGTPGSLANNGFGWAGGELFVRIGSDPSNGTIEAASQSNAIRTSYAYRNYNGLDVRFANNASAGVVYVANAANAIVSNTTISRLYNYGVRLLNAPNALVRNNTITGGVVVTSGAHVLMGGTSTNVEIRNNVFDGQHTVYTIGVNSDAAVSGYYVHHNLFKRLTIGMNVTTNNNQIFNNEFDSNWDGVAYPSGFGRDIILTGSASGNIISGNNMHDGYVSTILAPTSGAGRNKFIYNVVRDSSVNGIYVSSGGTTAAPDLVANNTIIHNPTADGGGTGHGIVITSSTLHGYDCKHAEIKNNIFVGETAGAEMISLDAGIGIYPSGMDKIDIDYNLYYQRNPASTWRKFTLDNGGRTTDFDDWKASLETAGVTGSERHGVLVESTDPSPFLGITKNNFRLTPSAPAIDAGASLGLTLDNMDTPIPQGTGVDIGAFEYFPGQQSGIDIAVNVESYISLSLSTTELNLDMSPTTAGTLSTGQVDASVSTNSEFGYNILFSAETENTSLIHDTSEDEIESTDAIIASPLSANTWGYALGDPQTAINFLKIPSVNTPTIISSSPNPVVADIAELVIGAKVNSRISAGVYSGTLILSVLAGN